MRALHIVGNAILWLVAVVGVLSALVFGATQLGYLKPLVVISGSMEPKVMTGDLLFDTPHPARELKVGDVASIPSAVTGKLISHRVIAVQANGDHYEVNLKGDANHSADAETYVVGGTVWQPVLQVPHGGYVITKLTQRNVAIPLGVTLLALLGLTLISGETRGPAAGTAGRPRPEAPADDVDAGGTGPREVGEATSADAEGLDTRPEPYFPDRIADLTGSGRLP